MDAGVISQCRAERFQCLDWSSTATGLDGEYVPSTSTSGFRALGRRKLESLLFILQKGIDVVMSDADCVWLESPVPMIQGQRPGYEDYAHADLIMTTDCLDPSEDAAGSGCFNMVNAYKNTGVLAVRSTAVAIATLKEWASRMESGMRDDQDQTIFNELLDGSGPHDRHRDGNSWVVDEPRRKDFRQFAERWCARGPPQDKGFNKPWGSASERTIAPRRPNPGSRFIYDVCLPNVSLSLLVGIFSIFDVTNGHTFFVQQLQLATARSPLAVHATHTFGDLPDFPYGKRQRLRDWGLWAVEDENDGPDARYLVLGDAGDGHEVAEALNGPVNGSEAQAPTRELGKASPAAGVTANTIEQRRPGYHSRGRWHVLHITQVRQQLAHAFALARALNRIVVLPRVLCWCDKHWSRLDDCATPGAKSSQPLPFVCPLDHVIDPALLHGNSASRLARSRRGALAARANGKWQEGVPFRGRNWLRTVGTRPQLALSAASLVVDAGGGGGGERSRAPAAAVAMGTAHQVRHTPGAVRSLIPLPAGRSDVQLRDALGAHGHVRLLHVGLSDAAQLLRCYEAAQESSDMARLSDFLFKSQTPSNKWCYRPKEMPPEWQEARRRGPKPGEEPWCVWGFERPATPGVCAPSASFPAKPKTLSVVLPCAFEYGLMQNTAKSVFEATPPEVLHEIVIVDDGSNPPLRPLFKDSDKYKVTWKRHDQPKGLIGAKKTGADAATGDIIVFFDCHVKPDPEYWKPMVAQMQENYKRVVVPTITNLNVDTWTEFGRPAAGQGMSKCYLTFDAEFKWTTDSTPYVPVMSGGLLAMSRRWWHETGGYDEHMIGWGGENLDQSLRIWLCGGEIVSAPTSYVAHMWRDGSAKTARKYSVPFGAVETNRARAAKAHMGPWFKKVLTFPAFARFANSPNDPKLDVSNILSVKEELKCNKFDWYLDKFAYIYRDGGLLPRTIFQLEMVDKPDMCAGMQNHGWGNAGAPDDKIALSPCKDDEGRQWWHRANRHPSGDKGCCTSIRSWNCDQCFTTDGRRVYTGVCNVDSADPGQFIQLEPDTGSAAHAGKLHFTDPGRDVCVAFDGQSMAHAVPCAQAPKFTLRHAKTPVEFELLSDEQKKSWPQ